MFLSCLLIDVGDNPDRPRPGRRWLRNRYHVHQRLCMAFPSRFRKDDDPDFLYPFNSEDFAVGQVRTPRAPQAGFLYRLDPGPEGRVVILVQSAVAPDWDYAFHNAKFLLAAPWQVKEYQANNAKGERLRFRLEANPTRRLSKRSPDAKEKSIGKRVPVPTDQLVDWLARRAESAGFSIGKDSLDVLPGYVFFQKPKFEGQTKLKEEARLRSVRFEGLLEVTDAVAFRKTLASGIGSGKAFGFGLLSVAPART